MNEPVTDKPAAAFQWIRPPWIDEAGNFRDTTSEDNPEGDWPWCGDPFLFAVQVHHQITERIHWEYAVLMFDEDRELCYYDSGDLYFAWKPLEIEWIARIPEPTGD